MWHGEDLRIKCKISEVKLAFGEGERKMGKYLDTVPVSGKTPKTPEKSKK